MKVAMYYCCPYKFCEIEERMYNRGKLLKEKGFNITYIFSDNEANIDILERFSEIGRVINIEYCDYEEFDFVIYESIYNNEQINARFKVIQIVSDTVKKNQVSYKNIEVDEYVDITKDDNANKWDEILKIPEKKDFKIAIIIPNYNYADCLPKCFNSILEQTYKNYEIVFVDDMSTDDSLKIAQKMLKPPHKIIPLRQKRLNGGARNEAYLHISDDVDYIWYVDSDDWLKDKYVLENINLKLQRKPDVVFLGMASYKQGKEETCFIPEYKSRYDAIKGWSGSCGKVIKKSLATRQECLYNEGTLKEDKNQHCKICIYMDSFVNLKKPVYVWNRENSKSVTTVREKVVWGTSTIRHYADTIQLYLSVKGKDPKIDEILEKRIELTKNEMMTGGDLQY